LIATYVEVKYRIDAVLKELKALQPEDRGEYKRLRGIDISTMTPQARAARFIYLNRYCFNGIYRTNLAGQFNVPYSGVRRGSVPQDEVFRKCSNRLRRARFINGDFEKVLKHAERGDLVYVDPPSRSGRAVCSGSTTRALSPAMTSSGCADGWNA
jgi:DNA adenine methylase